MFSKVPSSFNSTSTLATSTGSLSVTLFITNSTFKASSTSSPLVTVPVTVAFLVFKSLIAQNGLFLTM